ncbi:MAG: hypothetical protein ORO03_01060 [Alphaproteobacteria bacterium]|nr:hypothetical protein [Alphaproteobacteria bacterium]
MRPIGSIRKIIHSLTLGLGVTLLAVTVFRPVVAAEKPVVVQAIKVAAERGDLQSQLNLGILYETGKSVKQDFILNSTKLAKGCQKTPILP